MMGSWIDLEERRLTTLPEKLFDQLDHTPKTKDFRILTKEDTRKYGKRPENLSAEELKDL